MRALNCLTILVLLFALSIPKISFCQGWVKTFSSSIYHTFSYQLTEDYDHGIIIGGNLSVGRSIMKIGWIIKTDINGNILWEKQLGNGTRMWALDGIDKTPDGGVIVAGVCDTLDVDWWDPFIVKLTACGEIEWCHVFHTDNDRDYGMKIKALPDGSYIFLLKDWEVNPSNSVWLMHLDVNGAIIWEQRYFQSDTLVSPYNETALDVLPDGKYLVTGTCYRPDSGQVQPYWVWPMMIMADSTGEAVWEIPWGYALPFPDWVNGEGFQSIKTDHAIYSCTSNYHGPDPNYSPCLIKTSLTGEPVSYHDLIPNTAFGKASTITRLSDSVFFIGVGYQNTSAHSTLSVLKTDTLGSIIKETILNHTDFIPWDAILTQDNKLLITAWNFIDNKYLFYLWKLNQNLDFDSIYTQPRVYDSLCPYPVTSSTLYFQCDLVVGMEEPVRDIEKVKMHIYPNPGNGIIHVEFPECIQKQTETKHLTVTTIFHKWYNDSDMEVFDLFGRLIFRQVVSPSEREVLLDVSKWSKGMYYLRLSNGGTVVATEKVVVN
ncbi:MAG: T9SS type A sorting domain-containing protein [Bacteroidales bacterium]|nr:T9SS type A sorting domain-containing protein [Bacteroidales bacterium]